MTASSRFFIALVVACGAAACGSPAVEEIATKAPVPVSVEAAATTSLDSRLEVMGVVTPAPGADWVISAPDAGRIAELPKAEGDRVRKGDVLVQFDIPSLASTLSARTADVSEAQARVETTRAAVTRLSGLVERGVASRREVEEARRDQSEAEAALARAQGELAAATQLADRATVSARFAGIIAKRWHNPGDFVEPSASDPVLRVIDPRALQVVASIPAADVSRVKAGQVATVTGPGDLMVDAKVATPPAQMDATGSVAEARLAVSEPARLTSGMTVRVSLVLERREGVVTVPATAVLHEDDETFVMVAGADKQAHRIEVETGATSGDRIEIASGLTAGDQVIVKGHAGLPDGAAVTVTP